MILRVSTFGLILFHDLSPAIYVLAYTAVLCCGPGLHCAVKCIHLALLCFAAVYCTVLCLLCFALPWPTLLCPTLLIPALLCSSILCLALPCPVLPCPALPCPALLFHALPCPALPCIDLPCPALPCPVMSQVMKLPTMWVREHLKRPVKQLLFAALSGCHSAVMSCYCVLQWHV